MRALIFLISVLVFADAPFAQVPIKEPVAGTLSDAGDKGSLSGRTYTNAGLAFELSFPETWELPGNDIGGQTVLEAPETIGKASKLQLGRALDRVEVLLTVTRAPAGMPDNAVLRVTTEDIRANPAIKDAVDYFDLMRSQFQVMKLPKDFRYGETNAEQLGSQQFAFLETSTGTAKKRMYATVRKGVALMFTLTYTKAEDLRTLRDTLAKGNFKLKK